MTLGSFYTLNNKIRNMKSDDSDMVDALRDLDSRLDNFQECQCAVVSLVKELAKEKIKTG